MNVWNFDDVHQHTIDVEHDTAMPDVTLPEEARERIKRALQNNE